MDSPAARRRLAQVVWAPRSTFAVVLAAAAFIVSFSPSLLPRAWWMQAMVAGLSCVSAYAVGALVSFAVAPVPAWLGIRLKADPLMRSRRRAVFLAFTVSTIVVLSLTFRQDRVTTARLVNLPPPSWAADLAAVGGGLALAIFTVLLVSLLRSVWRVPRWFLRRALPDWVARLTAAGLIAALVVWSTNAVLIRRTMELVVAAAAVADQTPPNLTPPTSPLRSGGPGAAQAWEDLGHFGQAFTARGPNAERIEQVTGSPAREPIRVYASLAAGEDLQEIADTVVHELRRTGAFDRSTLVVVTPTGRGWIGEFNAQAVEYLTGGDVAIAAMQYSFLGSHVAVTTDSSVPLEAGRVLFDTVHAAWSRLPEEARPRLYVAGESLGAYAGTAPFVDGAELLEQVDGAVWVGTPSFTPLWRKLTTGRDRGSPEVAPVIDAGRHIRFATRTRELTHDLYGRPLGAWMHPRVVFLQYPSDPVVWWSPDLVYKRPAWIGEQAGHDVNKRLNWWPLITFWQLTVDNLAAGDTGPGHGHIYGQDMVPVWDAVLHGSAAKPGVQEAITTAIEDSLPPGTR